MPNTFWISPSFVPSAKGDVVARSRVEPLPGEDPHDLLALGVIREEPDVLLELEPRLLDEAEGPTLLAGPFCSREGELVLVDHQLEPLVQYEPVLPGDV